MLTVQFFLRGADKCTHPEQNLSVYCQLSLEDSPKRDVPFSTNHRVPLRHWWNYQNQKPEPNGEWVSDDFYRADNINRNLQKIERTFLDIMEVAHLMHLPEDITYTYLRERYDPSVQKMREVREDKKMPTLAEILNQVIEAKQNKKKKKKLTKNTIKTYNSRKNNILLYLKESKQEAIKIDKIRYSFVEAFAEWLSERKNDEGDEAFCNNYQNKHITLIRQCLEYAVNRDYLVGMPIGDLGLEYDDSKPPHYLLPLQRLAIEQCNLKILEKTRDVAIFLMYTGFSYVDYKNLKPEHLIGEGFKVQRQKSKEYSLPPLLPQAKAIIEKYGGIEHLPRPDDSDLNKELKFLGAVCGLTAETIGFELSTSDFRETFASMLENEMMFEQRPLMAAMGHKNPKQLRSYSRLMPQRVLYELRKQQDQMARLGMTA
jgi:integrase